MRLTENVSPMDPGTHCSNASTQMDLGSQRVKLLISEYRIFTLMLRHLSPSIKLTE